MPHPDPFALQPPDPVSLQRHVSLKLLELGLPTAPLPGHPIALDESVTAFLAHTREKDRLLSTYLCPADARIQNFIYDYLGDAVVPPKLPSRTLVLDRPGLARFLSLPPDRDVHVSPLLSSYRLRNGVLHNPKSDRRTTAGTFHVAEGGLPIPDDKKAVPREVFAQLLRLAFQAPAELLRLPFTATQPAPAECFVSLLLRPRICPEVPGFIAGKSMETRFFVPGSLVANLDFVESIFGNAGNPYLPENDAGLDVEHWSGQTGCVIVAPHLLSRTKKELGLPPWERATGRQRRDGMCWRDPGELYNEGSAYKLTARDSSGVILTIITDNYFGYCKKEVKTQISFAANLHGLAEEEHAGGALVFPCHDLAGEYDANQHRDEYPHTFADALRVLGDAVEVRAEGYAVDRLHPEVLYLPETTVFRLDTQSITWVRPDGAEGRLKLLADHVYLLPSGFKVHLERPAAGRAWRLVGTRQEGTLCHKPCTVSGGGKSEISKPISDAIIHGPVFVADVQADFAAVDAVLQRDYSARFADPGRNGKDLRPLLSTRRTLGSVIKLLTPRSEYSDAYLAWLEGVPQHIKELVLVVKRFWKPSWGDQWRDRFTVDIVNGKPANELRLGRNKLITQFLRVGYAADGNWRTFGLRKDFHPSFKLQLEDDITASVVVPAGRLRSLDDQAVNPSLKFVENVEARLFQRPDDATVRGYDRTAEADFAAGRVFFSNYEPLAAAQVRELVEDNIGFAQFTPPMQALLRSALEAGGESPAYVVTTACPRLVDGQPSKNPRYLQLRGDLAQPRGRYVSEVGARLNRRVPPGEPVPQPVHAVLAGRRNNPADGRSPSLACYGPIHYMELPELFMEFISSMTGRSPSTTGAGSEGALTKGPFNALPPVFDLNAALVSFAVTGYAGFITSAGCLGPRVRVDHDISLLVPELWARMGVEERDPGFLIANGYLERCQDLEVGGRPVRASRLGWRVTPKFARTFLGRVFNHPHAVLTEEMLRPERQDPQEFADAVETVVATHRRVAEHYFADGSVEWACPPLKALLHLMRDGHHEGRGLEDATLRGWFRREAVLASDWYAGRLRARQRVESRLWRRHAEYLERFLARPNYEAEAERLGIRGRLSLARVELERLKSPEAWRDLSGTLGAEPALVAE